MRRPYPLACALGHDYCCVSGCPAGRNLLFFKRLRQEDAAARQPSATETTTLLQEHGLLLASERAQRANSTPLAMSQVLQHLLALAYYLSSSLLLLSHLGRPLHRTIF